MKPSLKPGLADTRKITVDEPRVISFMGEDCRVYATPRIIGDVEYTCRDFLLGHLDEWELGPTAERRIGRTLRQRLARRH